MPKLNILEVDEDGGFDLDNVEVVEEEQEPPPPPPPRAAPPAPPPPPSSFIPMKKFAGARRGYVFKKGGRGVGYYLDNGEEPPAPAAPAPAAPAPKPKPKPLLSQAAHKIFELRERGNLAALEFAVELPGVDDPALVELTPAKGGKVLQMSAADKFALDLELRAQCEPARAEAYLGAGTLTIRVPFSGMALPAA